MQRLARLLVECAPQSDGLAPSEKSALIEKFTEVIKNRFGKPNLPLGSQTVAVTFLKKKTCALFFDRVWHPPAVGPAPPSEISVYGATEAEVWSVLVALGLQQLDWSRVRKVIKNDAAIAALYKVDTETAKNLSDILLVSHGVRAVPVYESNDAWSRDYSAGDNEVLIAAIENLGIVDEERLDWQQIMDFREDPEAKAKLRRMRNWLDTDLVGRPASYIADALGARLDDYEWALRKHGIETVTGSLQDLLDVRFLPAAFAAAAGLAVTGGPLISAIGAAGLTVGKVTLSITTRLVDLKERKRGKGSEVAFIHKLKGISDSR
jgi:hypothetical protein